MQEVDILFFELNKWLWFLGQRSASSKPFPIFPEQCAIDDFWHEFILSTKDYHAFCNEFIGHYIHHVPTPNGFLDDEDKFGVRTSLIDESTAEYISQKAALLESSMLEVVAVLGLDTMKLWYRDFPEKYFFIKKFTMHDNQSVKPNEN